MQQTEYKNLIQQTEQSIISNHLSFTKSLLHVLCSTRLYLWKNKLSLYSFAYNHPDNGLLKTKTCRKDNTNDKWLGEICTLLGCYSTLHNIPEECRFHLHEGESLKSCKLLFIIDCAICWIQYYIVLCVTIMQVLDFIHNITYLAHNKF